MRRLGKIKSFLEHGNLFNGSCVLVFELMQRDIYFIFCAPFILYLSGRSFTLLHKSRLDSNKTPSNRRSYLKKTQYVASLGKKSTDFIIYVNFGGRGLT